MKKITLLCILFSLLSSHLYGESHEDVKKYISKAESLFLKQCNEEKDISSCSQLMHRYDIGYFPSEDSFESTRIYREKYYKFSEEACIKGDFEACRIWHDYLSGNRKDLDKAAKVKDRIRMLIKKQLTSNDPVTLYLLGFEYRYQREDHKKADQLFRSSCELGYFGGCASVSDSKLNKKGIMLAEQLCNEGNGDACSYLGRESVKDEENPDPKESERQYQFYKKGCDLGHAESCLETATLTKYR